VSNPNVLGRTLTDSELMVLVGLPPTPYSIKRDHPRFEAALAAIEDPEVDHDHLVALFAPADAYERALADSEAIDVTEGVLFFNGEPVKSHLADRLLDVFLLGLSTDSWENLARNIYANPDTWVREDLVDWLELSGMPQTPDGCFLAWKYVDENLKSVCADIDGTHYDHTPGNVVEMPRERCDTNRNSACSTGLHFCSIGYLGYGGGGARKVLVKVDPRDVTSIPREAGLQKGRCCRYEVIAEITDPAARQETFTAVEDVQTSEPESEPETPVSDGPIVHSDKVGDLTPERFKTLVEHHGSQSKVAAFFGVSSGTVAAWKRKLFGGEK
jgi:hypothetical protein